MTRAIKNRMMELMRVMGIFMPVLWLLIAAQGAWGATPSGTVISNTASAAFVGSAPVPSNTVNMKVGVASTQAVVDFMRYAPSVPGAMPLNVNQTGCSTSGASSGPFTGLPEPKPLAASSPIPFGTAVPLVKTAVFDENEVVFVRLVDGDQNLDSAVIESVVVTLTIPGTNDSEVLRLQETGPDTGVFLGYINMGRALSPPNDCLLSHPYGGHKIHASYVDAINGDTASSTSVCPVDPYGLMFDSTTGAGVNGAVITLINDATGLPATVTGDDGVSTYPSTVTTGGTVVDSGGNFYIFPQGEYRFPLVAPGNYHFNITPANAYRVPSNVPFADLQRLRSLSYTLDNPGSLGGVFNVPVGTAVRIDIPTDPVSALLYLTKTASKSFAAIGDFLQYRVSVENTSTQYDVDNAVVSDKLPLGFRYRKGSATLNGAPAPDPTISGDGRTLMFSVGSLHMSGGRADISYVVYIAAGAKIGKAVNAATAAGTTLNNGKVSSNVARATVQVTDDLMTEKSFIAGRVAKGCDRDAEVVVDGEMAGIRIYLEDGTYTLTDKKGMYHFAGIKPGTHVVELDKDTLPKGYEIKPCEENTRFAGSDYSQFVDVQGSTLWRADFYVAEKPKPPLPEPVVVNGQAGIELASVLTLGEAPKDEKDSSVSPGELSYSVHLEGNGIALRNPRVTVLLPEGVVYIKGSSTLDGVALDDPTELEGSLTYRLGDEPANWHGTLKLKAALPADAGLKDMITKAMLTFDSATKKNLRTPLVENAVEGFRRKKDDGNAEEFTLYPQFDVMSDVLSADDKEMMAEIIKDLKNRSIKRIIIEGHTDSNRVSRKTLHIFPDNYALSRARAKSVADFVRQALDLKPEQIRIVGYGPDRPVATNKTAAGRALNRRVEMKIIANTEVEEHGIKNARDKSGLKTVDVSDTIQPPRPETDEEIAAKEANAAMEKKKMPVFDSTWLDAAKPGFEWVWPLEGFNPPIPSLKVDVKHAGDREVKLFANGEEVNAVTFDDVKKSGDGKLAVSSWFGIGLQDGDNVFEAVEYDNGVETGRIKHVVHYSTHPVKAELVPAKSKLVSDGKTPAVLAIRLTDKDGYPVREGMTGDYVVNQPFMAMKRIEDMQEEPLTASKSDKVQYQVDADGIAYLRLQPTTRTGEAVVVLNLTDGPQEIKAWMKPDDRDWILVGLAEGSVGYNAVNGNMESLGASETNDRVYGDNRTAFFAKGKIKGKWLLTVAYDSDKSWSAKDNTSLHQTIAPDQYYTVYGDGGSEQYEAASARPLYVKIERDQFYALFGDFSTGLTVTTLSRYNRNFNGFKSELKEENYEYNAFVSDNNQQFVKDEIRGDGTAGLYRLSRPNIVLNSETIVIETRDRYRSEVIVSSRTLARYIDYSIDYQDGTLYFKSPISVRDGNFNPNYIVVNYETYDAATTTYNYGGRGAVRVLDKKVELGGTLVKEDNGLRSGTLTGADTTVKITDKTTFKAEVASTSSDNDTVHTEGNSYLAEVSHREEKYDAKAYIHEQGPGFGLGQQSISEKGTRKYGADATYRPTQNVSLNGDFYRQYKLYTLEQKDMAEVTGRYSAKGYELYTGVRHAEDTDAAGNVLTSEQLIAGARYNLLRDKLTLSAERDQSIMNKNESTNYPSRTSLGADYKFTETVTLNVRQEFTQGNGGNTSSTQSGLTAAPWTGVQVNSALGQQITENGARVFSSMGLKQAYKVNDRWTLDGAIDTSNTHKQPATATPSLTAVDTDFTAVSLGAGYKVQKWSWTGRVERRHTVDDDKVGLFTAVNGEAREGVGVAAGLQGFNTDYATGNRHRTGDLRLGVAYRPAKTHWIILDRLDYIAEEEKSSTFHFTNSRIVNNIHLNAKLYSDTQISLHYGAKYLKERIDSQDYRGYTDHFGGELRYDLTRKWDVGFRASILHSWSESQCKSSMGPSVGYNVMKNVWISVGYNFIGFRDRDFSNADWTAMGPYIKFRIKLDRESARDAIRWFTGQ